MPPKRKRNAPVGTNGSAASWKPPNGSLSSRWGWVSSEVLDTDNITMELRKAASNLSMRNGNTYCQNKYAVGSHKLSVPASAATNAIHVNGELSEDVIIVPDTDEQICTKRACKTNPWCLNYLGQELWEEEEDAWDKFIEAAKLGEDPSFLFREAGLPVGLKNLGATCYANASLQVWFRFAAFRAGVYACEPPDNMPEEKYKDSPLSQLQVTFAALQTANQKVFNPTRLVESLQLRTSEQQDAQEFSKLFMTHLDAEFKKQNSDSLKTLITDQFQGTQVYGTICQSCKYRSETSSEFLEIEVSFKNNAKLEDCISTSLLPETLSGENRYLCSGCRSLQNATRYTELRKLPPVLHFSLMRFVYDLNTMERKKSKHSISFPLSLDMNKFLGSPENRRHAPSTGCDNNIYELRGVLLHKGASAYHGHYEAQVYDAEHESWFLFNDEHVTKIDTLGDKSPQKQSSHKESGEEDETADVRKKRTSTRKRRRIEDSDDDVLIVRQKAPTWLESMITSKDAYMLIYAKRDSVPSSSGGNTTAEQPEPPHRAMKVVEYFNDEHVAACHAYTHKENALRAHFTELRRKVQAIYRTWSSTPDMGCVVVSRQTLESWLSTDCIAASLKESTTTISADSDTSIEGQTHTSVACADIICDHGFLDPEKCNDMKCITSDAYQHVVTDTNCEFTPILEPSQVCSECVAFEFRERLYQIEHPRFVKLVDEVCSVAEGESGYWISKKWYKDWRLIKPKMHVASQEDPGPDSPEFNNHVYCEHGGLTLNTTNRRKMSVEAVDLLKNLFPHWEPLYSDVDPCAICETEISLSREDKREVRRRVEDEKARLRFILEPTLDIWAKADDEGSYAAVSTQFVRDWKRWTCNPLEQQRPERIDNNHFFCHHELLAIDFNCPSDLDSSVMIIQRDEWNILNSIYEGGPLIALSKKLPETGGYQQDTPVCQDCRIRRKTEWDTADIVIRQIGSNSISENNKPMVTYGRPHGSRHSKRIQQIKEGKRRIVTVRKSSTVKEIKLMVQFEFSVPTICQRLFLRGQEIEDNKATVESLQILANETLDLREDEDLVDLTSDGDEQPSRKKKKEGNGFSGTLLGNADVPWYSSPEQTPYRKDPEKDCPKCTFSNPSEASSCQLCDQAFA